MATFQELMDQQNAEPIFRTPKPNSSQITEFILERFAMGYLISVTFLGGLMTGIAFISIFPELLS
jgi:hypothetical protein